MKNEEDEDVEGDNKKKRALSLFGRKMSGAEGSIKPYSQVETCTTDMTDAKPYHRKHGSL